MPCPEPAGHPPRGLAGRFSACTSWLRLRTGPARRTGPRRRQEDPHAPTTHLLLRRTQGVPVIERVIADDHLSHRTSAGTYASTMEGARSGSSSGAGF